MKNKFLYAFICALMSVCVFASASLVVSADTEAALSPQTTQTPETTQMPETTQVSETTQAPDTIQAPETTQVPETTQAPETTQVPEITQAPETQPPVTQSVYSVKLLNATKYEYTMTEKNGEYSCKINFAIDYPDLFMFSINKDGKAIGNVEFLLYKATRGEATFTYNLATGLSVKGGADDAFDTFDMDSQTYLVSVEGGKLEDLPGNFRGKNISTFYYAAGDNIVISATVDDGKQFKEWQCSDGSIKLKSESIVEFTLPNRSSSKIDIKAVLENKAQSFAELLMDFQNISLEQDYVVSETIKLTEGEYYIDLAGHELTSSDIIFEINGAVLTISGNGGVKCTGSSAILLKSGALIVEDGEYAARICSIDARGGSLTIKEGIFAGGTQSAVSITPPCETVISGGTFNLAGNKTALSVTGGKLSINGGTFYGAKAIEDWDSKRDITIHTGSFISDVSHYLAADSELEKVGGMYNVKVKEAKYNLQILGGTGSGTYKAGDEVVIVAKDDDGVSIFEEWTIISGSVTITDKTQRSVTIVMPECDLILQASFKIVVESDTNTETTAPETTQTPETTDTQASPETTQEPVSDTAEALPTESQQTGGDSGSFALIILVIVLCALLVAAIAVSIIILIRKYNMEKETQERTQLSEDIVADLADKLSALDFDDAAIAGAPETEEPVDLEPAEISDAEPQSETAQDLSAEQKPREMRRLRKVPSTSFEPEDLTVTRERDIIDEGNTKDN